MKITFGIGDETDARLWSPCFVCRGSMVHLSPVRGGPKAPAGVGGRGKGGTAG
jgi:hypothetical protein